MTKAKTDAEKMTEALSKEIEKPPLTFRFPDEAERPPLKMSYGLELDIRRVLPDPQTAMQLLLSDPFTQDYVLRRCLTDKQMMIIDLDDLIPMEEVNLDEDTRDKLLMWAAQHAMYFFAKRTQGLARLGVQLEASLPNLPQKPLPTGSEDSAS